MLTVRKYVVFVLAILLTAFGLSFQMRAAVGIAPFDALAQTIAYISDVKVGDIATIFSIGFVVAQLLI